MMGLQTLCLKFILEFIIARLLYGFSCIHKKIYNFVHIGNIYKNVYTCILQYLMDKNEFPVELCLIRFLKNTNLHKNPV